MWFFDGNEECYKFPHILLAIPAVVCLLLQILLILFIAAAVYYKTLRKKVSRYAWRAPHTVT